MKKIILLAALWSCGICATTANITNNTPAKIRVQANANTVGCEAIGLSIISVGGSLIGAAVAEEEIDRGQGGPAGRSWESRFIDIEPGKSVSICRVSAKRPLEVWLENPNLRFRGRHNDVYDRLSIPSGQIWDVSVEQK